CKSPSGYRFTYSCSPLYPDCMYFKGSISLYFDITAVTDAFRYGAHLVGCTDESNRTHSVRVKVRQTQTAPRTKIKFANGPPSSAASRSRPPNPYAAPGMYEGYITLTAKVWRIFMPYVIHPPSLFSGFRTT